MMVAAFRPWLRFEAMLFSAVEKAFMAYLSPDAAKLPKGCNVPELEHLPPRLVPEQEQAGADHHHRADDEADGRHVAPDGKAEQHRPDQRQILERHHRRGRREMNGTCPPVLAEKIAEAVGHDHWHG